MTEIYTIEGGQKDVSSLEGTFVLIYLLLTDYYYMLRTITLLISPKV